MTIAIETVDLTRRFGRTEAVNGLNLQVPAGSIFALLGPNGAGKTTTLKVLMNLVRADARQRDRARRRLTSSRPARLPADRLRLREPAAAGVDDARPAVRLLPSALPDLGRRAAGEARVGSRADVTRAAPHAVARHPHEGRAAGVARVPPGPGRARRAVHRTRSARPRRAGPRPARGVGRRAVDASSSRRTTSTTSSGWRTGWGSSRTDDCCFRTGVGAARALPARRSRAGGRHAGGDAGETLAGCRRDGGPYAPVRRHAPRRADADSRIAAAVPGVRHPDVAASPARDLRHARAQLIDRIAGGLHER